MGRSNIAECGKRFSSEYQPAGRGRPKGSLNRSTIFRAYLKAHAPQEPDEVIKAMLKAVFPTKRKRRGIRKAQMSGANKKA